MFCCNLKQHSQPDPPVCCKSGSLVGILDTSREGGGLLPGHKFTRYSRFDQIKQTAPPRACETAASC